MDGGIGRSLEPRIGYPILTFERVADGSHSVVENYEGWCKTKR
jgi:hypothetical protein